jgi:hypothetical protein
MVDNVKRFYPASEFNSLMPLAESMHSITLLIRMGTDDVLDLPIDEDNNF